MAACNTSTTAAHDVTCRNSAAAAHLKLASIIIIFITSVIGITSPLMLAKSFQGRQLYDKALLLIKCFAAGVILSTSLVHVLPDAFHALDDCVVSTRHPWKDFPFAGLVTLIGALLALLVELTATTSHGHNHAGGVHVATKSGSGKLMDYVMLEKEGQGNDEEGQNGKFELAATSHGHNHAGGVHVAAKSSGGKLMAYEMLEKEGKGNDEEGRNGKFEEEGQNGKFEREAKGDGDEEERVKMRQRLVSQVLEIGIIFHSIIIGVTMGMSQNTCTIKPLVAALAFHQVFEGMGLGGCIAQAGFNLKTTAYMSFMFSVTTPVGIVLGMIVFAVTGYDDNSMNALIWEGLLGALSSGILIYMALVDLISADFFHNKMMMGSETKMRMFCYVALACGSASMSILALWA